MRRLSILILISILSVGQVSAQQILLRLHGSNTVGASLAPALVKEWLNREGYKDIHVRTLAAEEKQVVAETHTGNRVVVEIKSHGSGTAFRSLLKGMADIGLSSRPIKEKENNRLKNFGDMTRLEAEYVIGLDGIAVIVNRVNPISQLDKSVIRDIFTGRITHWQQINKHYRGKIQVYARDDKSGTFDTFKALVIGKKLELVNNARRYESNAELSDDVAIDPMGIGFVGLPYVRQSKSLAVSEKGTIARTPRAFEVATEDYALARRLYMYVADKNANPHIESFINFCNSVEGQQVVDATGFISQNLRAEAVDVDTGFPQEYIEMTRNSQRLSLNFRFNKGKTSLDNKARRDIERLVEYMKRPENNHRKVMIFGFAEASESLPVFSLDLSTYRVDWVSDLLIQKGIDPVRVRAYGDAIPVTSNEDAGGRHKNRRVEVWLR